MALRTEMAVKNRCPWAKTELYVAYHDHDAGVIAKYTQKKRQTLLANPGSRKCRKNCGLHIARHFSFVRY